VRIGHSPEPCLSAAPRGDEKNITGIGSSWNHLEQRVVSLLWGTQGDDVSATIDLESVVLARTRIPSI